MTLFQKCVSAGFLFAVLAVVYGGNQCAPFLKEYTRLLVMKYSLWIAVYWALLWFCITMVLYEVCRSFSMRATGRNLEHMDRTVRKDDSVLHDLNERLQDE